MKRVSAILALFTLSACQSLDLSESASSIEESQCRQEAERYPGGIEDYLERVGD